MIQATWKGAANGNFRAGRAGHSVTGIVIHVMDGTLPGTDTWFNTVGANVSAHYGVGKDGAVHQYVEEKDEAFHAGTVREPAWPLICAGGACEDVNPNLFTIGIEHEGLATDEWPDAQYWVSAALVADICARNNIPIDAYHIVPHRAIRADKTCPGKGDVGRIIAMAFEIQSQRAVDTAATTGEK